MGLPFKIYQNPSEYHNSANLRKMLSYYVWTFQHVENANTPQGVFL